MKKIRPYLIALVIVAVLATIGVLVFYRGGQHSATVKLPDGRKVKVTPTNKMRVYNAEGTKPIDITKYRLKITGLVDRPLSLTLADIKAIQAQERLVKLPCVEGWNEEGVWKGPRLLDLLKKAGVQNAADNAVFSSPGGYTTSLTLEDVTKVDPLLAYGVNGGTLPDDLGFPARLVAPNKLGYKWIKWVTGIKLIKGDYKGYWESRGYDNKADATGR